MNPKAIALFMLSGALIGCSSTAFIALSIGQNKDLQLKIKERQMKNLNRYLSAAIQQMTPVQLLSMLEVAEEHTKFDAIINED